MAKRVARKSPAPRTNTANAQAIPTCPHCQRAFHARIGLVGHLRTQCTNNPTIPTSKSNSAKPPSDSPTLTPGINLITPTIIESTSKYSSSVTSTAAATTATISDKDCLLSCPHCDRTFTQRIGLVGHLRIHRTKTGEQVPGAQTQSRDRQLHCPYSPRAFTHRMGLFGHMHIHDSRIHCNADNTDTLCTLSTPAIYTATATPNTTNDIPPASPDFPSHTAPATSTHPSAWLVI
ncbi:unnamed protein product [Schistocephalus solidus]|uniref:C2H2-type domain-containing protein n=1 Tax=Schistocephalus solidus TaxID=70667 RepID=A0A183T0G0_SCHSO|nr:unnamed protein product [Schistocephalus solidus]